MSQNNHYAAIGRLLLASLFILSGFTKLIDWQATAAYMASKDLPLIPVLLPIAAIVEIAGGVALLAGAYSRIAAFALFLYLIPTSLIFHNFWAVPAAQSQNQMIHFMKNVSMLGGLLYVIVYGSGPFSVDSTRDRR